MRYILFFFTLLQLATLNATSHGQPISGHVTLANGDRLPAKIETYDQNQIQFGSSLFTETVSLETEHVSAFGFQDNSTSIDQETSLPFVAVLTNGTRLSGNLISLDQQHCEFTSPILGRLKIPTHHLIEIHRSHPEDRLARYSALNWQALTSQQTVNAAGLLQIKNGDNRQLVLPQRLSKNSNIQFEFLVDPKTEFKIILRYAKDLTLATIGVTNGDLLVEANDVLEFGEFQPINQTARLSLNWHEEYGIQLLNELGQPIATIPWDKSGPLSVTLQNDAQVLELREIVINAQPHPTAESDLSSHKKIVWTNHEKPFEIQSVKTRDSKAIAQLADQSERELPVNNLNRIWFGAAPSSDQQLADTSTSGNQYVCHWLIGDRLTTDEVQLVDGQLTFKSDAFESSQTINQHLPAEVLDTHVLLKSRLLDDRNSEFRLAINGAPYSGVYSWGDENHPVKWQFFGFPEPVTLNIRKRKIEIDPTSATANERLPNPPDRIVLKDGSILPCLIETSQNGQLQMTSDRFSAAAVPLDQVRCLFFESSKLRWRQKLTRETIQKTLAKPRFQRDNLFSHVLIGKNGDLLRGNLIGVHPNSIEFESRYEPLLIDRKNVACVIALHDAADPKEEQVAKPETQDHAVAHIECGNDFVVVGKYVSLDDGGATIESPFLGRLQVPSKKLGRLAFNSRLENVSKLQEFTHWKMGATIDPRWEEELEYAANANELLNQPAIDFELAMLDDSRSFRLADHAGKIVVLYFWESDSRPSVLGLPEYLSVVEKFSPRDVVFIALNQQETQSSVSKFTETENLNPLAIGLDHRGEVASLYKVTGIPQLTIIDRNGTIRSINIGYSATSSQELETKIRQLLK